MSVTIILAVAHALCRRGLRLLLEEQEAFHVMAEATKGLEAIQLIQALQPKILIVDFMLSDLSALEITWRVRRHTSGDAGRHAISVVFGGAGADEPRDRHGPLHQPADG
jgi:DNA-binding NarL/FixJ family response regulator